MRRRKTKFSRGGGISISGEKHLYHLAGMKKKTCNSEVRVEIVRPSPLDAVRFKEVGDFLFQYGILGVRDDALMHEDLEEWAIDC